MRGIKDSLNDQKSLLDPDEANQIKQEFSRQVQESRAKKIAAISEKNQQIEAACELRLENTKYSSRQGEAN